MAIFYEAPIQFAVVSALDTTPAQDGTTGTSVNILLGLDSSGNLYLNGVAAEGGAAVASVFGRAGVVTANTGDYTVAKVTGAAPLASPTFTGVVTLPSLIESATLSPTSAGTAGVTGQIAWDATHIYVCTAGGIAGAATWKAAALSAV